MSHSISQFQIADHKAYSVRRPQSIPFARDARARLERALCWSNEPKNVNKRGRVWRWETQSISSWFQADCVSELALSQDQIYMVVYDRRVFAREYETYNPLHPPTLKSISKYGGFWQEGMCKSIWNITLPHHPIQPQNLLKTTEQGTF